MISHTEKDNIFSMLHSQNGRIKYFETVYEYSMDDGGVVAVTQNGIRSKPPKAFNDHQMREEKTLDDGTILIRRNSKFVQYERFLEDSFSQFEDEIQANIYELSTENKDIYVSDIKQEFESLIKFEKDYLENIWRHRPNRKNLIPQFIEYIKKRNVNFETISDSEIAVYCGFYLGPDSNKESTILPEDKKLLEEFKSYYLIDGLDDNNINTLEINIELIQNFLENVIEVKFKSFLTGVPKTDKRKKEVNHSFFLSGRTFNDNLVDIFNKLKEEPFISGTTLPQFKKIFKKTQLDKIELVEWTGSIASLNYFIQKLHFENKYEIASRCFSMAEGKFNLDTLKNNKQVSKRDKKVIDTIFENYPLK